MSEALLQISFLKLSEPTGQTIVPVIERVGGGLSDEYYDWILFLAL